MPVRRLAAAVALCAATAAGCGLGPGADKGEVDLTVSRDYGAHVLVHKADSIKESDTVLRVLDRNADISTRYGGGFVQSIDGLAGGQSGGRSTDWFFYVNGIEAPIGSAQYRPADGDRIWWDYRDWTAAMRVPAVVGSWPEPFVHGFQGHRWPTTILCEASKQVCAQVRSLVTAAGITTTEPTTVMQSGGATISTRVTRIDSDHAKILVGDWQTLSLDPIVRLLAGPPSGSGVFARFAGGRRPLLDLLNDHGDVAGSLGHGAGLVAALRSGDGPPTWVVTGTDGKGVAAAASLVGDGLRNHYAVATDGSGGPIPVPVP